MIVSGWIFPEGNMM